MKYDAFISYRHLERDMYVAKKVHKALETTKIPRKIQKEIGRKRINRVFRDQEELPIGSDLGSNIEAALQEAGMLIVICSPNSAKSEWVGKEIEFFHQLGRIKQIHFFIVDGMPHSGNPDTECFNPIVNTLGMPEILGANIHEKIYRWLWMNKERAYVQLISKLLGVEFDAIWQRHKRLLIQKIIAWAIGILVILLAMVGVWITNQPVDVEVRLNEVSIHNANLPPLKDAIVTMTFENETKTDTIQSLDETTIFTNIPHRFINKQVHVSIACQNFISVDTVIKLSKNISLNISRNPEIFGNVHFRLWNPDTELTFANTEIIIDGHSTKSDNNGYVSLTIPLKEQKQVYPITASIHMVDSIVIPPCGPNDVIIVK